MATMLLPASCNTGNEDSSGSAGEGESSGACVIGMTQIHQTAAFFIAENAGAREAAEAAGCELTIANANHDAAKQSSNIANFTVQGVTD